MANLSRYLQEGRLLDYTPAAIVTAGKIVQLTGGLSGFCPADIAASELGAAAVAGVIRGPWTGEAAKAGCNVWWDANGTPYGGAADGAFTALAADGDWWVGTLVADVTANDATADIALNQCNPNLPAWPNKTHVASAVDLTYVAATHNGMVIHFTADDKTLTLPTGVAGMEAILVCDVADEGAKMSLDFDGNETLEGNLAIAATKLADLTKATARRGDYIHVVCQTAASLWLCKAIRGTWLTSA